MRSIIIIPARLNSARLSRKLLLRETGKSVIQHTYEAASRSNQAEIVCVAADCEEIAEAVRAFGGNVVLTDPHHASGSDRVSEAAGYWPDAEIVVNVQGDEPEIAPSAIDALIKSLERSPNSQVATLATPIWDMEKLADIACVKVVFDNTQRALYFSRSIIPFPRAGAQSFLDSENPVFYQHIGVYAYRRSFLLEFPRLTRPAIETAESLEQLRILHAGVPICVEVIPDSQRGIDTPDDYAAFVKRMCSRDC